MAKTNWRMINQWINRNFWPLLVVLYLGLVLITPQFSYEGDIVEWKRWSVFILENGIAPAYSSDINYPPFFLYLLKLYTLLFPDKELIEENIIVLKWMTLCFDLLPLAVLKWMRFSFTWINLLLFLNIGYLHNTLLWGQVDAIPSFFASTAIFVLPVSSILSWILISLAVCAKIQTVVFLPVFFLCWYSINRPVSLRNVGLSALAVVSTFIILFLPFILNGQIFLFLKTLKNQVGLYKNVSLNAFNVWYWLLDTHPFTVEDTQVFGGISYRNWGLLLFFIASFFALLPLFNGVLKKQLSPDKVVVSGILCAALINLLFFFLNTEMHERYSHTSMLLLFYYGMSVHRFVPFIMACLLYFLNNNAVLPYVDLSYVNFLINEKTIALLFGLLIVYLYMDLYKKLRSLTCIFKKVCYD